VCLLTGSPSSVHSSSNTSPLGGSWSLFTSTSFTRQLVKKIGFLVLSALTQVIYLHILAALAAEYGKIFCAMYDSYRQRLPFTSIASIAIYAAERAWDSAWSMCAILIPIFG
jgi:hypothetical protein